jgi:hypothetical protein
MELAVVECGELNPESEVRVFKKFVPYFQREVEIFQLYDDNSGMLLFRPSDLARLLDCQESRIGMILHRKQDAIQGVYRAARLLYKPSEAIGLRSMSYFLDLRACEQVRRLIVESTKPARKGNRHNSSRSSTDSRSVEDQQSVKSPQSQSQTQAQASVQASPQPPEVQQATVLSWSSSTGTTGIQSSHQSAEFVSYQGAMFNQQGYHPIVQYPPWSTAYSMPPTMQNAGGSTWFPEYPTYFQAPTQQFPRCTCCPPYYSYTNHSSSSTNSNPMCYEQDWKFPSNQQM